MAVIVKNKDPYKIAAPSFKKVREVVGQVLKKEGKSRWLVEVAFICNRRMQALNKKYRRKNRTTDVLSFPMGEEGLLGDVFISKKEAERNALARRAPFKEEVFRLLVHGVLHLLGYEHGRKMFSKQERFLKTALGGSHAA